MKNINKIIGAFIISCLVLIFNITNVQGSFADFTDEEADKQAQEQIKEQEKEHNITEVKSSDNYLTSLQIEGYTLTPEFDKQILEYTIKEDVKANNINIKAVASNDKATIRGNGEIKLENGKNEYRIDVTAEVGTVRTYIIKLNQIETDVKTPTSTQIDTSKETENNKILAEKPQREEINNIENPKSNTNIYIIITIVIGIVIILLFVFGKGRKKKRHKSKH